MGTCKLENVCKKFGNAVACDHVSFEVGEQEFQFILGPSGAGKTTTLRILAGLEIPDSGRIFIDGKDVTDCPPEERPIAMIFQQAVLYPHMTVRENIEFPLKINKYPKNERNNKIDYIAKLVKIDHKLDQNVTTLSGGEIQRAALGRLFVQDASIYLMDEALNWLDAKLKLMMRTEIKILQEKLGVTIISVTHDQAEALSMGSSLILMNNGVVQQRGNPYEIYNKPNNAWVANFIGSPSMNFLEGVIRDDLCMEYYDARIPLSKKITKDLNFKNLIGKEVIVGFRPESMNIFSVNEDKNINYFYEVAAIEFEGPRTFVDLIDKQGKILKYSINSKENKLKKGDIVGIKWSENTEILFDKDTGERIC